MKIRVNQILTKSFLEKEYLNNKKSSGDISKELGCDRGVIQYHLRKHNIKIRSGSERSKLRNKVELSKELLINLYNNQLLSITKISKLMNCSFNKVLNRMKEFILWNGIKVLRKE